MNAHVPTNAFMYAYAYECTCINIFMHISRASEHATVFLTLRHTHLQTFTHASAPTRTLWCAPAESAGASLTVVAAFCRSRGASLLRNVIQGRGDASKNGARDHGENDSGRDVFGRVLAADGSQEVVTQDKVLNYMIILEGAAPNDIHCYCSFPCLRKLEKTFFHRPTFSFQ
jgi:hypothetical protein